MKTGSKGIAGCGVLLVLLILVWKAHLQAAVICNDQDGDKPGGNKRGLPSQRRRSLVVCCAACGKQIHR